MTDEHEDQGRPAHRPLLPEEQVAGSDDPERESDIILEDSAQRTDEAVQATGPSTASTD